MKEITSGRCARLLLTLLFCFVLLSAAMFAQSTTAGAISGQVSDATNAVVSSAKISVTNNGTGDKKQSVADSYGKFRILNLQPGTYTLEVTAVSFAGYKATGVIVEVGRVTETEVSLKTGSANETVEVTSEAPTVNTMQQDFNSNIDQSEINNLPINGRRWSTFALLTPGATADGGFGLISFRGISGLLNNNTVDGGDNNQAFFSEERGRTRASYTVSQSSIREFQVNTSNYSSEYGRAAGGVVNSVTKSGGNGIHGEVFYYIRDNALGATNPFTRQADLATGAVSTFKPEDRRQQFGGNVGGALIKDKLFYFFNYDGQRRNFPGVGMATNPQNFLAGITVAAPLNKSGVAYTPATCPTSGLTEGQYLFCHSISQAKADAGVSFLRAETGTTPRTGNQDILFPKIDFKVNQANTLTLSYNRMRWASPAGIQTQPTVSYAPNSFGSDFVKTDMFIARLTSTVSASITNEFRYQWGRDFEFETSQLPSAAETAAGLNTSGGGTRPPYMTISAGNVGSLNMGRYNALERTAYPDEKRNQFANTTNIVKGRHLFKFGVDFDRNSDLLDNLWSGGGTFAYSNSGSLGRAAFITDLANFESNTPTANYSSYTQAFGPTSIKFDTWDFAYFLQDDWKILPRLTINLGIRYEYEKLPGVQYPNPNLPAANSFHADKNNFGPRVGFAWDVYGDGKTALRGGYGIYYGRINNGAIAGALFSNGAPGTQVSFGGVQPACGPKFAAPWASAPNLTGSCATSKPSAFYFDPNLQNPQIHQADLILEREVSRNTVFSLNYLLSLGRQLPNFVDKNIAPSTSTVNYVFNDGPYAGQTMAVPFYSARLDTTHYGSLIDEVSNINSSYNALAVQFNRKMSGGVQWLLNYTWSHALDNGQNSQTQTASYANAYDPYNPKLEYGNSNFDKRHKFVASVVYQPRYFVNSGKFVHALLDGWGLAPLVNVSSGTEYTEGVLGNSYLSATGKSNFGVGGGINGSGGVFRLAALHGRNSFSYPVFVNADMRLSRKFHVRESHSLEVLGEAFNLFNHRIATGVNTSMYSTGAPLANQPVPLTYSSTFGQVNQAGTNMYRERQIQLALRYAF